MDLPLLKGLVEPLVSPLSIGVMWSAEVIVKKTVKSRLLHMACRYNFALDYRQLGSGQELLLYRRSVTSNC